MNRVIIVNTDNFRIDSYGNGLSYLLLNKITGTEVFFQGEDAGIFRTEWEEREHCFQNDTMDNIYSYLWGLYSEIATETPLEVNRPDETA